MHSIYQSHEHHYITDESHQCKNKHIQLFNSCIYNKYGQEKDNPDLKKYLGIHQTTEYIDNLKVDVLKAHYFIGYRWVDTEHYVNVSPKINSEGLQANYLEMLMRCLNDPIVSTKLEGNTYEIFYDEPWIEIEEEETKITPLIVLHFLKIVNKLIHKGLKKGYVKVTENLTSKIKGKILINQTIKQNHLKNRLDRTMCEYQVFTVNCLENVLIKTALMQCSRHLGSLGSAQISQMLQQNINAFELVDTKEVFSSDFIKVKHSPFFKEYQEAIKLSKMIFKRFGFTLNNSFGTMKHMIPPFYINMPELFERYVEVELRQTYPALIDGNQMEQRFEWSMRPDFLLNSDEGKFIIDAKYKYWFHKSDGSNDFKDDYKQLSLYGRAKKIRKIVKVSTKEEVNLVFIYPTNSQSTIKFNDKTLIDHNFEGIYKFPIHIPSLPS